MIRCLLTRNHDPLHAGVALGGLEGLGGHRGYRKMQSLIRKIEDQFTQATSGNIAKTIQFSADYGLSRALTLRAFYDLQINEPIVSTSSYPTSNSNYGISLRFSLAQ